MMQRPTPRLISALVVPDGQEVSLAPVVCTRHLRPIDVVDDQPCGARSLSAASRHREPVPAIAERVDLPSCANEVTPTVLIAAKLVAAVPYDDLVVTISSACQCTPAAWSDRHRRVDVAVDRPCVVGVNAVGSQLHECTDAVLNRVHLARGTFDYRRRALHRGVWDVSSARDDDAAAAVDIHSHQRVWIWSHLLKDHPACQNTHQISLFPLTRCSP